MRDASLLGVMAPNATTGRIDVQLAEIYLQAYEWGKALISLKRALKKGGLDDVSYAYLLLSAVYSKLDQVIPSKTYYQQAQVEVFKKC